MGTEVEEVSIAPSHDETIILDATDDSIIVEKVVFFKNRPKLTEYAKKCVLLHCLLRWKDTRFVDKFDATVLKHAVISKEFSGIFYKLLSCSHLEFCANWNPIKIFVSYKFMIVMDSRTLLILHLLIKFRVASIELWKQFRNKLKNGIATMTECFLMLRKPKAALSHISYDVFKQLLLGRVLKCNNSFVMVECCAHHVKDFPYYTTVKMLRLDPCQNDNVSYKINFPVQKLRVNYTVDRNLLQYILPQGNVKDNLEELVVMLDINGTTENLKHNYFKGLLQYYRYFSSLKHVIAKIRLNLHSYDCLSKFNANATSSLVSEMIKYWQKVPVRLTLEVSHVMSDRTVDEVTVVKELRRVLFGQYTVVTTENGEECEARGRVFHLLLKFVH
ncbi:unnamed protein product [Bursaphelenchus okinawaensis]|uniref:Uncharacterized protein n=1 Tax=Bursaphelenchus okinawaensis TaxID=465554 RepID=A0A811K571_9BILA|nr:unnamed protein product [Bursaphelenchus okinawaensis]CAG9091593.1 unnamed protein product [Bursaphelenchus okinawaensis]